MRVLLVDGDEPHALRTEAGIRASMRGSVTVQRVGSMGQAIRALTTAAFDIVVLELSVRDASGIATLAGVRGAAPATPIVVYTAALDDALALRALRAGAQECLCKAETDPTRLGRALLFAIERHRRLRSLEAERVEAAHRATHDALTGLANRELFLDHLEQALAFGARYGRKTGMLFVDLDGFKRINDLHGHTRGDALLRVVAERLIECVRRSDAVGRIGGDEFVVLLPDVTSRRDVAHVRETILTCLREPVDLGNGHLILLDASVGGAMSPLDGHTAQALLDAADTEMYREKHQRRREREGTPLPGSVAAVGRGDESAERAADKVAPEVLTHRREARLREAVRAGEFEVHYQPIVDVPTARFHGAEALLRWRDPDRGLVLPESFLGLAEDTGLIVPLGEHVLRESCRSVVAWRSRRGASTCRVSVNISAVQLRERGFVRQVAAILAETGCPADALTLELTENSMLVDGEIAIEALRELKALGTRLVVDDFGVGFASLTFVREAPIDGIKLDRRFVSGILRDSRDEAIIASIIRLAQGLELDITAEGVESADQAVRLTQLHCFKQQGQYFSHPLTARDLEAVVGETGAWSFDPRPRRATTASEIEGRAVG
jgi:diguanylate cyclase (GGDEF)-like protein